MKYAELPIEKITLDKMPFYHQNGAKNGYCSYIRCGDVKRGGNEPYCNTQEKQCAGHICRIICPETVIDRCTLIRDDGTVWTCYLSAFENVCKLEIIK